MSSRCSRSEQFYGADGSCGRHLQQRTRCLLLQVGPRQEDKNSLRIYLPRDMLLFRLDSTGYPDKFLYQPHGII